MDFLQTFIRIEVITELQLVKVLPFYYNKWTLGLTQFLKRLSKHKVLFLHSINNFDWIQIHSDPDFQLTLL